MADLFKIVPPEPVPDTVKYLEDLLERAKSGDIQGFGIVIHKSNACTANGWTGITENCMAVIGELETLKVDIIRCKVDQRYDCHGEIIDK